MKTVTATFAVNYDFSESIDDLQQLENEPFTDEQIKDIVIENVLDAIAREGGSQHVTVRILSPDDEAEAAYLDSGGTICPHCSSTEISGGAIDVDASIAWQNVTCQSCGAHWTDEYKLTGIGHLHRPN